MIGLVTTKQTQTNDVAEERIKFFVAVAVFVLLGAMYLFNALNAPTSQDIPTDLLVAAASLIVGYYFRGKR